MNVRRDTGTATKIGGKFKTSSSVTATETTPQAAYPDRSSVGTHNGVRAFLVAKPMAERALAVHAFPLMDVGSSTGATRSGAAHALTVTGGDLASRLVEPASVPKGSAR
jgi:hypothetical protein